MSLSDLAALGNFISGVAVLGSLVYLGLQTLQNSRHTRALIQQGRADQYTAYQNFLASDPALVDAYMRGSRGDEAMSDVEITRYCFLAQSAIYNMEDLVHQHRNGLLDEDRHAALINIATRRLQYPGFRAAWKLSRRDYGPEYQTFMDGLLREVPMAIPATIASNWKSLVRDELSATSS